MKNMLVRFFKEEDGATAIEYGLIAALIGVAILAVLLTLGPELRDTFQDVQDGLASRP